MSNKKIKIIAIVIVIITILATAFGVVAHYSNWFTNWDKFNPTNWDKKDQDEQASGTILNVLTSNGVAFSSDNIPLSDYAANGVAENADSAYTLTATIQPSVVENKTITWNARFSNVSSNWAYDKDIADYLTFNKPTTQSGESVVLTCLQDFGEQIIITASAEADSTKKALCSVDYKKKIKRVDFSFKYDNQELSNVTPDSDGVYRFDFTKENKSYTIIPIPIYSDYTIDVNYSSVITGKFTDTFVFGNGATFNNIHLNAFINDIPAPLELSENAKRFINSLNNYINNELKYFEEHNEVVAKYYSEIHMSMFRDYYSKLSEEEKCHPEVINAYEVYLYFKTFELRSIRKEEFFVAKEMLDSYNFVPHCVFMDTTISSLEDFLQNCVNCNNANKGVIEYFIKYSNGDFVYDYKISLGFTSSSLQAITDVEIDNGEIII